MRDSERRPVRPGSPRTTPAKVVAQLPDDPEMQSKLQEQKERDGYPGSCGL